MKPLILASGSPRRKQLLEQMNVPFTVCKSTIDETFDPTFPPDEVVQQLARQKAQDVAKKHEDSFILAADTIVVFQGRILGKPATEQEARQMLSQLSDQSHEVLTGVALLHQGQVETFVETTEVRFWPLTVTEIETYLQTGEPFDKAGAYGIQGLGAYLVKELKGDYYNVVGLPLSRTVRALKVHGFSTRF
ncbi:septum formation inhibitor Maf [Halalkalibacterium halodurans]|uniref:Maf family protein n=1 Tax=Halalkalibacterium halodurans TaxID=86665 RepID=UPI0010678C85|nr:Maf family protein [Halalkalibacterium halodurans]TES48963.1 septum formation inhibitor Maf [Halalkalibacterium halodurans]